MAKIFGFCISVNVAAICRTDKGSLFGQQSIFGECALVTYMVVMTSIPITGMTCGNCAKKVESLLKPIAPGVQVTLDPPRAVARSLSSVELSAVHALPSWISTYYPLLLVMGLIAVASLAAGSFMGWMMMFMGGFFTVFGAFKLLDVPAFAESYARYDIIAKVFKPWGYAYPFIETALGLGFFFNFPDMITLSWIALVLSSIGAIGVIQANINKQTIQCACLGTVFQLPMSVITVIENIGMAVMAAWMIWGM
jgi:copper chaperone CopZ